MSYQKPEKRKNWTRTYAEALTTKFIKEEYRNHYDFGLSQDGTPTFILHDDLPILLYGWEFRIGGGARADFARLDETKGLLELFEIKTTHETPNPNRLAQQLTIYASVATHVWFVCDRSALWRWESGILPYAGVVVGDEEEGKCKNLEIYREPRTASLLDAKRLVGTLNTKEIFALLSEYVTEPVPASQRVDRLIQVIEENTKTDPLDWKKKAAMAICHHRHQFKEYLRANRS